MPKPRRGRILVATDTLLWLSPDTAPAEPCTILVDFEGQIWPGVYANGRVQRYPEDFSPIRLSDCACWCRLPEAHSERPSGD